ncbi:MAG: EAL domain-containing protein [Microcystaceae cyanobacterium]
MNSESFQESAKHILVLEDSIYRRTIILEEGQYSLGRHSSNGIQMNSKQASRRHATLLRKFNNKNRQEVFWIIDGDLDGHKSQNGVYVNGEKCLIRELKDGDLINFGCDINASYHNSSGNTSVMGTEWNNYENVDSSESVIPEQNVALPSEETLNKTTYTAEKNSSNDDTFQDDSYLDPLTQLPNRALFSEYLHIATSNARRKKHKVGLLLLKLTNLSGATEALKDNVRGQVIKQVAKQLRDCLRQGDIVSRWSEEEFMILFPQLQVLENLEKIQQRIVQSCCAPIAIDQYLLSVVMSSSSVIYPQDSDDLEVLLGIVQKKLRPLTFIAAETAIIPEESVTIPANLVSLEDEANQARFFKIQKRLQQALDENETELLYQPQVNLKTGAINAIEAFIRWQHPQKGLINPKQFIPWMNQTEAVLPITQWVLDTACQQNKRWQLMGIAPLVVSINLSDKQFYHPQLLETIEQVLAESKLESSWLELEIQELTLLQNFEQSKKIMRSLNKKGINLSLDDFGKDYASARFLQEFPIGKVKIDPALIDDLLVHPQNTKLLSALISLGNAFDIQVVAKGVEEQSQLNILKCLDCFIMQGYRFSHPLNSEAAAQFLFQHHVTPPAIP